MVSERAKDLIIRHLEGLLSEKEKQELKECLKDPECKEYFRDASRADKMINSEMMKKAIEEDPYGDTSESNDEEIIEDIRKYRSNKKDDDKTRKFVNELDRAYQRQHERKRKIRQFAPIAAAAMVAVVLILWSTFGSPSAEKLYAQYYEKHQFELSRSDQQEESSSYIRALEYYNENNYETSMSISLEILQNNPDLVEARFIYALSLQETGSIEEAIEQYRILVEESAGSNERIHPLSAWYLGLCYVLKEEPMKALEYLNIAKQNAGIFLDVEEVEELIRRVGEI